MAASEAGRRELAVSVGLFLACLVSVFWVYGTQWRGGDPFGDPETAAASARFAGGVMVILLAHELGHYFVALRHGFRLSLPWFLPVPLSIGTLGAIIRLRSLPRDRTGLLEMGAAGPLAGFIVAVIVMALGLPGTVEQDVPTLVLPDAASLQQLAEDLRRAAEQPDSPLAGLARRLGLLPEGQGVALTIMANPLILDLLGRLVNGEPPGRYAELDPLALAGWIGCLITGLNLLPFGQLDGGHISTALAPVGATRRSWLGLLLAVALGFAWAGWWVFGVVILLVRRALPVPLHPPPRPRALGMALGCLVVFVLCFMPRPFEVELRELGALRIVDPQGQPLSLSSP